MKSSTSLWTFAPCSNASRRWTHQAGGEEPSAEAYLFSYLRMLETRAKDSRQPLSMRSSARWLTTACTTLDRSPELEESLLWIYKSHQRVEQQIAPDCGSARTAPAARPKPCRRTLRSPFAHSSTG